MMKGKLIKINCVVKLSGEFMMSCAMGLFNRKKFLATKQ